MKLSSKQLKTLIESEIKKKITEEIEEKDFKSAIVSALATAVLLIVEDVSLDDLLSNSYEILMGSTMQHSDDDKYATLASLSDNPTVRAQVLNQAVDLVVKELKPRISTCLDDLVDSAISTLEDDVL